MVIKTLPIPSEKPSVSTQLSTKKPSRLSQSVSLPINHGSEQRHLPDAADLRRMCIITKTDLNRIYENLDRRQRDKDAVRQELERKKELSERSAAVTKSWPNTIIGNRERKLELKKQREEKEEERRKEIDIEEEKLAAERRREQIEKAKQLQYYETDRVRKFHSALLLTEVLKERDLQIEMKKRIAQMQQNNEDETHQRYQEAEIEFAKAEKEKIEQRTRHQANLSKYHLAQMDQHRLRALEERSKDQREGEEYRRLAQQNALEQLEIEQYQKLAKKEVKTMYDKALEDRRKVKQIEQQLDEEEDEELRVYAAAKKKIARLRREKEVQVQQEKQAARDHMIDYLGSLQKRAETDNETKIIRARAEKDAKDARAAQEKLEKQQKMQESIAKHRHETIKRHEAEKEMAEREEADLQRKKDESDRLFLLYQQEKQKQRAQDAQATSQAHLRQVQERRDRQREMKANEYNEVQLDKHMNEVDRQQYQDYTGRVISYMEETGRNTYPLKRAVVDEMKRFDQVSQDFQKTDMPANTTAEKKPVNPNIQTLDQTKKHMGFQWNNPVQS